MKLPETSARNLFGRAPGRKGNMDANAFRNRKIFRFLEVMKIKTKLSGKFEAVKQGKLTTAKTVDAATAIGPTESRDQAVGSDGVPVAVPTTDSKPADP